jgi:alanyl-tRNA synthetase
VQRLSSQQIRDKFLSYFQSQQHQVVPSSSLVPGNDPSLLFTNSGMVQFKDVFLGTERRAYTRAASIQRCVRAGGKHNDLENVGYTRRHHTFFEMLGNFSFGDYFKREAIRFAWDFLTKELAIPSEKLWVTVYQDDQETEGIWRDELGVPVDRITRCGAKDNFWQMGDTGPCGPCTEIFYDHGPNVAGGPPGSAEADGDRYVEIWNVVFMQYERNAKGELSPLPRPCVDTGMGLERIAAVLQGVSDNYDIDSFQLILSAQAKIMGVSDLQHKSMRVIADHIRSCAFLILDGVLPSNEGRGYVLRRIMRRAIRHGVMLGCQNAFFHRLVKPLVACMGEAYPDLITHQHSIIETIRQEEEQFAKTLSRGLKLFEQARVNLKEGLVPGEVVFQLYDTYGFPPDLTADLAREQGLTIDEAGFNRLMEKQREQSQQANKFAVDATQKVLVDQATRFVGYDVAKTQAKILALMTQDFAPLAELNSGSHSGSGSKTDDILLVLDTTPFYAESGGQVGDRGVLVSNHAIVDVQDTQKQGDVFIHIGRLRSGKLCVGDQVSAEIDTHYRQAIRLNHSATHLLHAALRAVLGTHVSQKGSLVAADRLRFDFSHHKAMTPDEIVLVENWVNAAIRANQLGETSLSTPDAAKASGAMAMFGERYGEQVRVLRFGDVSTEICGGTHAARTGDIGFFKILSEGALGSGVRRIEALTGDAALKYVQAQEASLFTLAEQLKIPVLQLPEKLAQLLQTLRDQERELQQLKQQQANTQLEHLLSQATDFGSFKLLVGELQGVNRETLRSSLDQLKQHLGEAAILLASIENEQVQLVSAVTPACLSHFNAGQLLNHVALQIGGKGGGRPDMAQGGGPLVSALPAALASLSSWVAKQVNK